MRSHVLTVAGVGALLVGAPPTAPEQRNLTWAEIAAELGCPKKVHEQSSTEGDRVVIEYLPKAETLGRWTRMATFTLMQAPADDKGANKAIHDLIGILEKEIKTGGELTAWQVGNGNHGEVLFAEYAVKGEWNAAIVSRTAPGTIAMISLAGHGGAPTGRQRTFLRAQVGLAPYLSPQENLEARLGDALASRWFKVTSGGLMGSEDGLALSLGLQNPGKQAIWLKVSFGLPTGGQACEKTTKLDPGKDELLKCPLDAPVPEKNYPVKITVTEPGWKRAVEYSETQFHFSRASIETMERGIRDLRAPKRP